MVFHSPSCCYWLHRLTRIGTLNYRFRRPISATECSIYHLLSFSDWEVGFYYDTIDSWDRCLYLLLLALYTCLRNCRILSAAFTHGGMPKLFFRV